ncbi:MAG: imidazole glycerol phosphate synthase subunit HisH [Actinomycetota bacterium]
MSQSRIVVLDYGSGNVRSVVRALSRLGADVELTSDADAAFSADGMVVPGVGNFSACMLGLQAVGGPEMIARRAAAGRPVLGICVGHQVLFERSAEPYPNGMLPGLGHWLGVVSRLPAAVVPHMGWNTVQPPKNSILFSGVSDESFYFVHSYAVQEIPQSSRSGQQFAEKAAWAHHGAAFIAAMEHGVVCSTQFHPEKSGDAGAHLLENWVRSLAR